LPYRLTKRAEEILSGIKESAKTCQECLKNNQMSAGEHPEEEVCHTIRRKDECPLELLPYAPGLPYRL